MRWIGVGLIVLGIIALAVGGFSFTKDEKKIEAGPIEVHVKEEERVRWPPWLGFVAIGAGIVLVAADLRRRR